MIRAYRVRTDCLPEALEAMRNDSGDWWKCKVKEVIDTGEKERTVVVEMNASYPFVTDQWKDFAPKDS